MNEVKKKRRNNHTIGFNDKEYAEIEKAANEIGLYPRQLILQLIRNL